MRMKYEPEKLKEKRKRYRKRAIRIGMIVALAWTPIVAACGWHFRFYLNSGIRLVFAMAILVAISIVCFFLALLAEQRRSRPFVEEMRGLLEEHLEHKDIARYREKLLCMKEEPKNMASEELWYLTWASLLVKEKRFEEAITLFEQLEDGVFGKVNEAVTEGKEYIQDIMENDSISQCWEKIDF